MVKRAEEHEHDVYAGMEEESIEVNVGYVDKEDAEGVCFAFSTLSEIAWLMILLTVDCRNMCSLYLPALDSEGKVKSRNILQVIIIIWLLVLPCFLMGHVIGHISERGCVIIKQLAPIGDGIHFTMAVLAIMKLLMITRVNMECALYLIHAQSLPWIHCHNEPNCVGREEIIKKQFSILPAEGSLNTYLSAHIYYKVNFLDSDIFFDKDKPVSKMRHTYISHTTFIAGTFLIALHFIGLVDIRKHAKKLKICMKIYCVLFLIFVILMTALTNVPGSYQNFKDLFLPPKEDLETLLSPKSWGDTVYEVMINFDVALPFTTVMGASFGRSSCEFITLFTFGMSILFHLLVAFIVLFIEGWLAASLQTSYRRLRDYKGISMWFEVIPQQAGMSSAGAASLTVFMFFVVMILCILVMSALASIVISTLSDFKPALRSYRKYTSLGLSIFTCTIVYIILNSKVARDLLADSMTDMYVIGSVCLLLFQSLCAFWIHGVHNLCDDFHFKFGYQPSYLWKILWWPQPIILTAALCALLLRDKPQEEEVTIPYKNYIVTGLYLLIFAPHLISLGITIYKSMKAHNLRSLVKKTSMWGDPDEEERKARELYPPRNQCKYTRRFEVCRHRCIRYSKILPLVVDQERFIRSKILRYEKPTTPVVNPRPTVAEYDGED